MKYIKLCVIGFILSHISCVSEQDILSKHLSHLVKVNSKISLDEWQVRQHYSTEMDDYYCLSRPERDTLYLLMFSYFPKSKLYKCESYIKSYINEGVYHELSLLNKDTLYYFTAKRNVNPFVNDDLIRREEQNFKVGLYYFLSKQGKYNWRQMEFYESHKDSLMRIKGNRLPQLPAK